MKLLVVLYEYSVKYLLSVCRIYNGVPIQAYRKMRLRSVVTCLLSISLFQVVYVKANSSPIDLWRPPRDIWDRISVEIGKWSSQIQSISRNIDELPMDIIFESVLCTSLF